MAETLYLIVGFSLFTLGVTRAFLSPERIRKVMAVNVMGIGVFMVLLTRARFGEAAESGPDPVPHALVLTGIVVAAAATGLALTLARRLDESDGDP